jgi:hypothetical protein
VKQSDAQRAGCQRPGKHPIGLLVPHGVRDATLDEQVVTGWWREYPHANIGLATGHRFDVLDVDGPAGINALREFLLTNDAGAVLGRAPLVRTGAGDSTTTSPLPAWVTNPHAGLSMSTGAVAAGWSSPHLRGTPAASGTPSCATSTRHRRRSESPRD